MDENPTSKRVGELRTAGAAATEYTGCVPMDKPTATIKEKNESTDHSEKKEQFTRSIGVEGEQSGYEGCVSAEDADHRISEGMKAVSVPKVKKYIGGANEKGGQSERRGYEKNISIRAGTTMDENPTSKRVGELRTAGAAATEYTGCVPMDKPTATIKEKNESTDHSEKKEQFTRSIGVEGEQSGYEGCVSAEDADHRNKALSPHHGYKGCVADSKEPIAGQRSEVVNENFCYPWLELQIQNHKKGGEDTMVSITESPPLELKRKKMLSMGNFGMVYKADIRPETPVETRRRIEDQIELLKKQLTELPRTNTKDAVAGESVILKVPRSKTSAAEIRNEVNALLNVAGHVNVLKFVGMTLLPASRRDGFLVEYCEYGSLDKLHNAVDLTQKETFLKIARGLFLGLLHLHSINMIHRDISCRNLLVTRDMDVRISDFGLTVRATLGHYDSSNEKLPWRWMPPESLKCRRGGHRRFTYRSDIWAAGVTLWEIWNKGKKPYSDAVKLHGYRKVMGMVQDSKIKLQLPSREDNHIGVDIMHECLTSEKRRPSAADILIDRIPGGRRAIDETGTQAMKASKFMIDEWRQIASISSNTESLSVVEWGKKLFAVGGHSWNFENGSEIKDTVEVLDLKRSEAEWKKLDSARLNCMRHSFAMGVEKKTGLMVVVGGLKTVERLAEESEEEDGEGLGTDDDDEEEEEEEEENDDEDEEETNEEEDEEEEEEEEEEIKQEEESDNEEENDEAEDSVLDEEGESDEDEDDEEEGRSGEEYDEDHTLPLELIDLRSLDGSETTGSGGWRSYPKLGLARYACAGVVHDGVFYVAGGISFTGEILDSIVALDLHNLDQGWKELTPMWWKRCYFSMVAADNKLFVIGRKDPSETPHFVVTRDCEVFELGTGEWREIASLHSPRWGHAAVVVGRRIYVVGGKDEYDNHLRDVLWLSLDTYGVDKEDQSYEYEEMWDELGTEHDLPNSGRAHMGVAACDGKVYVVGGFGQREYTNTALVLRMPREE